MDGKAARIGATVYALHIRKDLEEMSEQQAGVALDILDSRSAVKAHLHKLLTA